MVRFSFLCAVRPPLRAVWKRGALSLFAIAAAISGIPQLCGDRAFAADTPTALSLEQKSQQVEQMLLVGLGIPQSETIMKWRGDIHIGLISDHAISANLMGTFGRYLSEVQRASGRKISIFGNAANFAVVFSENTQQDITNHKDVLSKFFANTVTYQKFFADYDSNRQTCTIRTTLAPDGYIYAFLLFVTVSSDRDPNDIDDCLRRGILAGFGIVHAVDDALDPANGQSGLTTLDVLSLKALYDPDLIAGANKDQIVKAIGRVINSTP